VHIIKDLTKIGRPIEKTIIIDNIKENYCWQKDNGIEIKSFIDDLQDCELQKLVPVLSAVA
jgi:TFIIF-interacting CTD phosphatase-like protein